MDRHRPRRSLVAMLAVCILNLSGLGCQGQGARADRRFDPRVDAPHLGVAPRILFDAGHHNHHRLAGTYRPFATLLQKDGCRIRETRRSFAATNWRDCDVLVIATALPPDAHRSGSAFTPAECDSVQAWVRRGGALLLVVDHYPFATAARDLAARFGVDLGEGLTEDPAAAPAARIAGAILFTRAQGLVVQHAITRGRDPAERIERVMTFTGVSLTGPPPSTPFLQLPATAIDRAATARVEQSGGDTRTVVTYGDAVPAAGRAQAVALCFGMGRVVVVGDSAMLTAQIDAGGARYGMNDAGIDDMQLALNIERWLTGILQ